MKKIQTFLFLFSFLLITSTWSMAQSPVIDADQLRSYALGNKKAVIVDTRTSEEYEQAHIPGAVNIMPEQMKAEAARLLKVKTAPVIFYCRGMG
jgi:rhodanese-related sulfurtransferase